MEKIAEEYRAKDVEFYVLYTREPHAEEKRGSWDFSDKKQTRTHTERIAYARQMAKQYKMKRRILIDTFGDACLQKRVGGNRPNSLLAIDKQGRVALWQDWSDPRRLREKLDELIARDAKPSAAAPADEPRPGKADDPAP